ncbi:MAG: alpha/beta fold hydrolase [Clostridia bacterium]|nr:alpha/beta fold hydrolase [Clostridia bacterium]
MELWNGFKLEKSIFEGRELITVFPEKPNGKWALKTEYFDAFPEVEIELLKLGYHIFHVKNITRWHEWSDTETRAKLAEFVHNEYGLSKKCVVVGMSCGGMQGIYLASKYPEYVSCMYLDAPVVNLFLCLSRAGEDVAIMREEFIKHKKMDVIEILKSQDQPLDHIPELVKNKIPVILVAGDSDDIVPYDENGRLLNDAYRENGCIIETIIKKGAGHHPHSLDDNTPIIDFIKKYDK